LIPRPLHPPFVALGFRQAVPMREEDWRSGLQLVVVSVTECLDDCIFDIFTASIPFLGVEAECVKPASPRMPNKACHVAFRNRRFEVFQCALVAGMEIHRFLPPFVALAFHCPRKFDHPPVCGGGACLIVFQVVKIGGEHRVCFRRQ